MRGRRRGKAREENFEKSGGLPILQTGKKNGGVSLREDGARAREVQRHKPSLGAR